MLAIFPAAYFALILSMSMVVRRNLQVLMPALAVLLGTAIAAVKKPVVEPLVAVPIWSGDIAAGRLPAAGETRSFRRQLVLDADVESAVCVITCDNGFELYVNGKKTDIKK